ncbi:MAG: serine/threonine-protein kinase, partial [Gemmatimonadales bacterium]
MTYPLESLRDALGERYTVLRLAGEGGMATVYVAHDLKHDRDVALKILKPDVAQALGRERFLREIKLAAKLQHPNILPVYDSGEAAGALYYVMPFVEGESLRDRLDREGQFSLEEAIQITREVADALAYAHSHDVVHRDIKPENVMLSGGHAVVADFGIARAISGAGQDKVTQTGLAIGTPAYMSPEQASGSGQIDRRSDIYSLGCMLYEMLAGQPPFTGPTAHAVMARHSLDAVPRLKIVRETVPDAVEDAIMRALAKVPADRFATAAQFAEALARPSVATPIPRGLSSAYPAPRRFPRAAVWA